MRGRHFPWAQARHIQRSCQSLVDPSQIWKSCSDGRPCCEILAIARWADMGWHCRSSPVLFRSAFAFWGRHDLTPKEQRQVRTANVLLVYAIAFASLSSVYGISNWAEHPDVITRHAWLSAPSIRITEQTRRFQALPNVHSHNLQHCTFGGTTRKPTRLMIVNMKTELNEELKKVERPHAPTGCFIS